MEHLTGKLQKLLDIVPTLVKLAGVAAVNFSVNRFARGDWLDNSTQPWAQRKPNRWGKKQERPGRALLVKTGRLRRSIRIVKIGAGYVIIGTNVPYAQVHNEGFRGTITQQVGQHTRKVTRYGVVKVKQTKRFNGIERRIYGRYKSGETTVKAHTRKIKVNIPKRQFMGKSAVLDKQIERLIVAKFNSVLK